MVTVEVVHAGAALVVNGWRTREYAFIIEYGIWEAIMICLGIISFPFSGIDRLAKGKIWPYLWVIK